MFKSIVLATDGSLSAKHAAAAAADLAATYRARLTIVTVLSHSMSMEDMEGMPQARKLPRSVKDEMRRIHQLINEPRASDAHIHPYVPALPSATAALGELILDEAESVVKRKKVANIARVLDYGDAATQLLKQANKAKADLIVMGTRGLSSLRGLFIGSVSNKVIHNSKCPILTVK